MNPARSADPLLATLLPGPVESPGPAGAQLGEPSLVQARPPAAVLTNLERATGIRPEQVLLSLRSDINLLGRYVPHWVVADREAVYVIDETSPGKAVAGARYAEVDEFRCVAAVGSGMLQASLGGVWIDLVRYGGGLKYAFTRLGKRLEQARRGEAVILDEEDMRDPCRCAGCGLMLPTPGEACPRCINRGAAIGRMLGMMRPHWRAGLVMTILLIIGVALDMMVPLLIKFLVDDVLAAGTGEATHRMPWLGLSGDGWRLLAVLVGSLAAIQIGRAVVNLANSRVATKVGAALTFDLRGRMVEHLSRLGLSYYDKQQTGSLVGRVAYDTEAVQGFMAQLTGGFLMQALLVVVSLGLMFSLDAELALWTLVPTPLVIGGAFIFWRYVHPRYQRFWDRSARQAGMLNSLLSGMKVVKAFGQEGRESERFAASSELLREARVRVDIAGAHFYPMIGLVFLMGGWIVWHVGGSSVLEERVTLGTLMAFFGYMGMFYGPLGGLTNLTGWLTQFSTQAHRIFEVLDAPVTVKDDAAPAAMPEIRGEVEFRHVSFGYSRQAPIVKDVCLRIPEGSMVGIVGHSGSGKTTLINLLARFYDVNDGQVLVDGVDIRSIPARDLHRQVGIVLQEPFLFRGTLWENLIYGRRDASPEQVIEASRAANAHHFVMKQIHAYDSWVGENGAGLSGGERQRLSIARALVCEPRILILDEATSSIDSESEMAIQQALAEVVKGRTSILIAHRLSTLRSCDVIFVVEDGRVVEQGSHLELMARDGRYARFARIQGAASREGALSDSEATDLLPPPAPPAPTPDRETGLPALGGHRVRWLRSEFTDIHVCERGALHLSIRNEPAYAGVFAARCFPVQRPNQFINLRWINGDGREQEVGMIRDLAEWPAEAQQRIRENLLRRYLVHTIERIHTIKHFHGYLTLDVTTDLGRLEFTMRQAPEAAQEYGTAGKLLMDLEENRYVIPDPGSLPKADQRLVNRYIYW
jgi:ATP-binding cassette, subfamily B, bacterial